VQPNRPLWTVGLTAAFALLWPLSASADELDLGIDWETSPSASDEQVDDSFKSFGWRDYERRQRRVTLNESGWTHFLIYHDEELIAQGYQRREKPDKPRVGTISDVVSYDNDYWAAGALESQYGEPDVSDVRTKREYSQELGNPAKRAERSVDWDLRGERYRWNTDDGTIRYSVRYSLKGVRDHLLVRVKPGAEKEYHFYQIARAFRKAGVRVVRRFELQSRKMVVAMVTSSGEVVKTEFDTGEDKLVPVRPEKDKYTTRHCRLEGQDCTMTFHTFGGRVYRVDLDLSHGGKIGRRERGGFEKVGERVYKRFQRINEELTARMGEPQADTSISDLTDDRTLMKVQRIPQGMEAFWTVWYNPGRDMLVRHIITGEKNGASWHVDHRVTFRLHSVTRAFADEAAWDSEGQMIDKKKAIQKRLEKKLRNKRAKEKEKKADETDESESTDK